MLRNATDLGNCLRPFYGDSIADRYAALIKEHLVIAAQLVAAATKGDTATAEAKERDWYRNADDIAQFLHTINPYLSMEAVQKMFYMHLALTKNEAVTWTYLMTLRRRHLPWSDMIAGAIVMQFYYLF